MPRIGQYEIEGELGRGGMGVVFRARSPDRRVVALKVLASAVDAQAFERERRLLSELGEAQGFVPLLDAGTEGARRWIAMPLLTEGTLATKLARGPLKVEEVVRLGAHLAAALACAHERGIVHRDLKPSNVLFRRDGVPLVSDLGLAKHFASDAAGASRSATATGTVGGTVGYMAPEQIEDLKSVGPACDVFALGVILYESLAGSRPFEGEGVLSYAASLARPPRPLRALRADVPESLERTVMRAIERDRARRFSDARGLLRALETRPASRRRVKVALAALALAGAGVALVLRQRPAPMASPPVGPSPVAPVVSASRSRSHLELAREARAAGDLPRALVEGELAVFDAPHDPVVNEEMKALQADRAIYEPAITLLDRMIEANGRNAGAFFARGALRAQLLDFNGDVADELVATELRPESSPAWAYLAFGRAMIQQLDQAERDASRAIALDPLYSLGWAFRALARSLAEDSAGTIADATRAIEFSPESTILGLRLQARLKRGDKLGTLRDLTRVLEVLPPDDAKTVQARIAELEAQIPRGDRAAALERVDASGRAEEKGAVLAALKIAQEAVDADPRCAQAWEAWGLACLLQGNATDAIVCATRALEEEGGSGDPLPWFVRGRARAANGDPEGALSDLERCLALGADAPAFRERAMIHLRLGDMGLAVTDARAALDHMRPEDPEAPRYEALLQLVLANASVYPEDAGPPSRHLLLAHAARAAQDMSAAFAEIHLAWVESPADFRVTDEMAAIKSARPRPDEAVAVIAALVEREPQNARAVCMRGELRLGAGDLAGAIADEHTAIELDPTLLEAWIDLANAESASGNNVSAQRDVTRATEVAPLRATPWEVRARVRDRLGDAPGAIADATRAIELSGGNPGIYLFRAAEREHVGDLSGELHDLRGAIVSASGNDAAGLRERIAVLEAKRGPSDGAAAKRLLEAARAARSRKDFDGALDLASKAVDTAPDPGAWSELAVLFLIREQPTLALLAATRAIEEGGSTHAQTWLLRGRARIETGDPEGALSDAGRALALEPKNPAAHETRARAWHARHDLARAIDELEMALGLIAQDDPSHARLSHDLAAWKTERR
jgi:tetratricopeptide (TPR) repeat protein/tRNA A-37 threonylcarbamoyl transferase component Bud32